MPITVNTTDTFEQWRLKTNDVASGLETNVTSVYSALTANIAAVNSNIASNVSTINSSIASNVALIHTNIASNVTTLNNSINTKLNISGGTLTGNITTPNNLAGITIGDDVRLADRNNNNTLFLEGVQNSDRGYVNFSTTSNNALGAVNAGNLTWRGDTVLHSSNYNSYAPTLTGTGASGTWNITSACTNRPLLTASGSNFFVVNTLPSSCTFASYNVAVGIDAGLCLTSGCNNNFFGQCAGRNNTFGCHNNFFGQQAGHYNTSGCHNNYLGFKSGFCNTNGSDNNFFGRCVGFCNTSGTFNNFFGRYAGFFNTTGNYNNFFGRNAGLRNTIGGHNNFFGTAAGCCNIDGCFNNFLGLYAGHCNTSGTNNNFFGTVAGRNNTTGGYNVFIGRGAGYHNTIGSNNIFIGCNSGSYGLSPGLICNTTQSNRIVLGNYAHTEAIIKIGWSVCSDIRDKYVWGPVPHGKGFLNKVNPIKFSFKNRNTGEITDPPGKKRYGFSAQEIDELEGDENVVITKESGGYFLTDTYIIPILVNAVKELTTDIEELKAEIAELKKSQ